MSEKPISNAEIDRLSRIAHQAVLDSFVQRARREGEAFNQTAFITGTLGGAIHVFVVGAAVRERGTLSRALHSAVDDFIDQSLAALGDTP